MTTPFPLLRLPKLELIPVLQQMEPIDIIALSLLSNRARLLTKTAGLSVTSISILAKNRILNIDIVQRDGKKILISLMSQNHTEFVIVFVDYYTPVWRILGLSTAELIHRILDVTNCESIQEVQFCEAVSFDALPILATLPHIEQIYISRDCNEVFVHKMFEMLSKVISNISMWQDRFANLEQFQKVLMLNMHSITIYVMNIRDPTRFRLSLDDLLICNAVHLHLFEVMISVKNLNRFFKLWIRNKSNPRLEHFILITSEEVSPDVLLKGLNAIEMPQSTTRTFRVSECPNSRCQEKVVTGGFDVMRSDGTRATLEIKAMPGISVVEFFVWM